MKIINRNMARKIKKILWVLSNYSVIREKHKMISYVLNEVAIIFNLNEDQVHDFLKSIFRSDFNEKFPVTNLRNKKVYIIQSNEIDIINFQNRIIIKVRYPTEFLLLRRLIQMNINSKAKEILKIAKSGWREHSDIEQSYKLHLLNEIKHLDIFTTISTMGNLDKVFQYPKKIRNYRTHMIYYAEPISISRNNSGQIHYEYETFKNVNYCDIHWVWTAQFARNLAKKSDKIKINSVGSIMFKMRNEIKIINKRNQIVIFDVSPQKHAQENSFHQIDLVTQFFEDIIAVNKDLSDIRNFDLILKTKRALGNNHLKSYRKLLNKYKENSDLKIVDWNVDPYSLIAESVLSISIPFTSIALIGNEVGTRSIYYYPFSNQLNSLNSELTVPIICGVNDLYHYIKKLK